MRTVKVSEKKIVVPRIHDDKREVKGSDWIPTKFPNIYACSLKGSGKTCVLTNILWHIIGSKTKVIIACPTVEIDPTWVATVERLRKKKYAVETFSGIVENQVNFVEEFIEMNKHMVDDDEDTTVSKINQIGGNSQNPSKVNIQLPSRELLFTGGTQRPTVPSQVPKSEVSEEKVVTERRGKKITPNYIIIIDDCGSEARNKWVQQLMKTNRHYKTVVMIASQHLNDLAPSSIRQLQYIFLFARFSMEKLVDLYKALDLSVDFDTFLKFYHDATKVPYGFLYIGRESSGDVFRKGFQEQYTLPENQLSVIDENDESDKE